MAKEKTTATVEPAEEKSSRTTIKLTEQESVYTVAELIENHKALGAYREIVAVALRLAGKKALTLTEAKKIVETFKNKEV